MLLNFKHHRYSLFNALLPNSIAILPGAGIKYRSHDVEYPFRQNSDFYYLTAYPEPDALAVFIKEDNSNQNNNYNRNNSNKFILFNKSLDLKYQIWHGELLGKEQAIQQYGADIAYPIEELEQILPQLLSGKEIIYYPKFNNDYQQASSLDKFKQIIFDFFKKNPKVQACSEHQDLLSIIHELRVIKSPIELEQIRYVTKISADAHNHIMGYIAKHKNNNKSNNNLTERHVQAEFYKYCLQHGCNDMAYQPIVAGGNNACILHYTQNISRLKRNELLLIDAGAEYSNYAADITRVFPINGKFSANQKEIYSLVLFAQKKAINQIRPGKIWSNIQLTILEILVQGLIDLKILSGNLKDLIDQQAYKEFYMHGSGHFLGLDVHDVGNYTINQQSRALVPGMVLTVEPGLYFPSNSKIILDQKWQGIGIRIEDDILVTEKGFEVLTSSAIKEIDEIENLMLN